MNFLERKESQDKDREIKKERRKEKKKGTGGGKERREDMKEGKEWTCHCMHHVTTPHSLIEFILAVPQKLTNA